MNHFETLKNALPAAIYEQLSNISFEYKGFHNFTFKAVFRGFLCQVRVPINSHVEHSVEQTVLSTLPTTLYYDNGVLIRKWFDGNTLEKVELTEQVQNAVIDEVIKFHNTEIDVPTINWFYYEKGTYKYQQLVKKYSIASDLVTSHCDLNSKNVLINKDNVVSLIDFEWVRKAHPFFDAVTLVQSQGFDKNLIMHRFNMSGQEFEEMSYIADEFREQAYRHIYANKSIDEESKQLTQGYTNLSYVKNDLFIQKKRKNGFNHLTPLKTFDSLPMCEKVIYEDENTIIRKFIQSKEFDFADAAIREKIANAIALLHTSSIKIHNNQIAQRIEYYLNLLKNHEKFNNTFNNSVREKILKAAKELKNEVLSHNDLNRANILLDNANKIKFIDFEYASMNSKYFDIAYHCSDLDYSTQEERNFIEIYSQKTGFSIDFDEYYRVKAIVNFYGIAWSLTYDPDFNFDWLAKHVFANLKYL
ncbi:phosphotransferase, partial [Mycoplasma simbae]|uniref:phosphotransferase n=1 Tax=Mycoplasma simbae TaxID=36744 RepID=UPI000495D11E